VQKPQKISKFPQKKMATINELKEVLKEHLESTGTLNEIRSRMRAEIFNTINNKNPEKAPLSKQNLLMNELIREYLLFNNYNYSHATFIPETGQPEQKLDREFLSKQLGVIEDSKTRQLP
jgi:lisH domain-containing protein FOPNL